MDKGTTNSGIPVFGEVVKMLDKEEIAGRQVYQAS